MKMSLPSVCSSMCLVRFCRELNCRLHSLQKSCVKSKPTESLFILGQAGDAAAGAAVAATAGAALAAAPVGVRKDVFGLEGGSSSFTLWELPVEAAAGGPLLLAAELMPLGEGAGLLSISSSSSSSSSSELSAASSFTRTLLLVVLLPLLLEAAGAEELGAAAVLLVFTLYTLWTMRMCLFNMSCNWETKPEEEKKTLLEL